jgi:DNA-binding transcriptional LysR family regulator
MQGLQQFVAFTETAKHGGFAAAARELGTVPSTIAKAVSRFERSLGVKLFHRTTRQVALTTDGERVFQRCQQILMEVESLRTEASGADDGASGILRVDMPTTYGREVMLPMLARLAREHPRLELDVRLEDSHVDLVRERVDVAVRIGALQDSTLVAVPFDTQILKLCGSPGYLAAHGTPRKLEDLEGRPGVVFRLPSTGRERPWQFLIRGRMVEMRPSSRLRFSDGEAMVAVACLGDGLVQVPDYMAARALAEGRLVELMPKFRPKPMPISAVYQGTRLLPQRLRRFLDILRSFRRDHE